MNSTEHQQDGGVQIPTPSARRPIHSYQGDKYPQLRRETMVRYGVDENTNNDLKRGGRVSTLSNYDDGCDEVDNVMSKMSRQTSPLSIKKKKIRRTNSYSNDEETTDENTDDSDHEEYDYSGHSSTSKITYEGYNSNLSNRSGNFAEQLEGSYSRRQSISSRQNSSISNTQKTDFCVPVLVVGIAVIAVLFIYYPKLLIAMNNSQDKSTQTVDQDIIIFEHNMNVLQEKYNIDDNTILKLKTGLSTIFSRMDTGSFIFIYNSKTNNFNAIRFDKFMDEISFVAARFLRNSVSPIQHTVLISSALDMQEHGELITKYRDDVDRSGVLLVKEVDEVPSDLAMAFHYYCDEYDPLVKRSAIFFTLNISNCSDASSQKFTHDFIEKCLANKWKTVPSENIRPLLTRVVDVLIDVTSIF